MFIDRSNSRVQFLNRVNQGTFLWNYYKIWPEVPDFHFWGDIPWNIPGKFGPKRCLKKLLKTQDGRQTQDHPESSPLALCAQVSYKLKFISVRVVNYRKKEKMLVTDIFSLSRYVEKASFSVVEICMVKSKFYSPLAHNIFFTHDSIQPTEDLYFFVICYQPYRWHY